MRRQHSCANIAIAVVTCTSLRNVCLARWKVTHGRRGGKKVNALVEREGRKIVSVEFRHKAHLWSADNGPH